ncbi:hypothetical protein GQX74_010617 [Glossina fuscipes]|nr:hypothetical protein GQX74_010617 [Glossina fuscipes]
MEAYSRIDLAELELFIVIWFIDLFISGGNKHQKDRPVTTIMSRSETDVILYKIHQETTIQAYESLFKKLRDRLIQALDLELLKDPIFWNMIIGMALVYTSTINFFMIFRSFLQNAKVICSTAPLL